VNPRNFILILLFGLAICCDGQNLKVAPLSKGTYNAGFTSQVLFDYAQNYPTALDSTNREGKYPKPIIINIWYPSLRSSSAPMKVGDYLQFSSNDKNISKWLKKYQKYNEEAIAQYLFNRSSSKLDSLETSLFKSYLLSTTRAFRQAKPAQGRFPVVIFHQGAGASMEDNSTFYEWMASNGYVVVGSSFQWDDGSSLAPGGTEQSMNDLAFLVQYVKTLPYADWSRMAMGGHSLGGQTANYAAVQGNFPFDAYFCLETTQEYHIDKSDLWKWVAYVKQNAENASAPFLFISNPHAIHDVADRMKNINRYYVTIPDIGHNDFISQGINKLYIKAKRSNSTETEQEYERARAQYQTVCNIILEFLNAHLKGNGDGWNVIVKSPHQNIGITPFVEIASKDTSALAYVETNVPPTPRQFKALIDQNETDRAIEILKIFYENDTQHPIFQPTFAYVITDYLLTKDKISAFRLYTTYEELLGRKAIISQYENWGKIYGWAVSKQRAQQEFEKLLQLDTENEDEVNRMIEKYCK
jgi:tetratricopeptide (TPR) repeat protein